MILAWMLDSSNTVDGMKVLNAVSYTFQPVGEMNHSEYPLQNL